MTLNLRGQGQWTLQKLKINFQSIYIYVITLSVQHMSTDQIQPYDKWMFKQNTLL